MSTADVMQVMVRMQEDVMNCKRLMNEEGARSININEDE